MMKRTHKAWAVPFWLGTTLGVNALAASRGYELPVHPAVIVVGAYIAPRFSSGILSPDMDHRWAPGPPAHNYDWRYHRGFTHRFWFAFLVIAPLFGVLPFLCVLRAGIPLEFATVTLAPVAGWFSHLFGDMIYGRLKVGIWSFRLRRFWTWNVGLGWETGGLSETGRSRTGGEWRWRGKGIVPADPAAKLFLMVGAAIGALHLVMLYSFYV